LKSYNKSYAPLFFIKLLLLLLKLVLPGPSDQFIFCLRNILVGLMGIFWYRVKGANRQDINIHQFLATSGGQAIFSAIALKCVYKFVL